ncbi:MAG TPA: hypothetical protein VJC39_05775 [Candidatus Nanoarchaeia archaeon]|nr:hypothetical protein [Candidatus Nanoarchaeia archaeon]
MSIFFVDRVQVQSDKQRKVPLPKKFWLSFPLNSLVKIQSLKNESLFYVDKIQAQGKIQRRVPLPKKFWKEFPLGTMVKVELITKT